MTSSLRRFLLRLVNFLRPGRAERELERELACHLEFLEREYREGGLSADGARQAAIRALGGVEQTKDLHRDARSFVWLDDVRRDTALAGRLLRRNPIVTVTAVLSLAVGIGANTAVFTLASALLMGAPSGVVEPARIVDIGSTRGRGGFGPSAYPNYIDVAARANTLDGVFAYTPFPRMIGLVLGDPASRAISASASVVTANYFAVLGARPAAGRLFGADDGERWTERAILALSHDFWQRRFDRSPDVVGRKLLVNGHPFTVVGVAAPGFQGTTFRRADVWLPLGALESLAGQRANIVADRTANHLLMGARLKRGIALPQAAAEIAQIGRDLEREHPENQGASLRLLAGSPTPGNNGPVIAFLVLLAVIVALVLLVACANVAGVLLARAAARRQEMALRIAIGAGRSRLIRQLLTETALLFSLGGTAGLLGAIAVRALVLRLLPTVPFVLELPVAFEPRVLIFTAGLCFVSALLCGLAPALQAARVDVLPALRSDPELFGSLRFRRVFLLAQVACSVVLVAGAALFVRALQRAASGNPGFEARGVELVTFDLAQAGHTSANGVRFVEELLDRARSSPAVESASAATFVPGGLEVRREAITVPGRAHDAAAFDVVDWNAVEPAYFRALRIPITAGRAFENTDREGSWPVAIVSRAAARRFWPGEDAVGRSLTQVRLGPHGAAQPIRTLSVIGVVGDVQSSTAIDGLSRECVYVPWKQQYASTLTVVTRTVAGHRAAEDVRALLGSMNPGLPILSASTLEDSLALGLAPQRIAASVAGSLGLVGLVLAAIGIYGATSFSVARRMREIGIRTALGARRTDVIAMVVREGLALTVAGSLLGLLAASAMGRIVSAFLFGTSPIDPAAFAGVAALFVAVSLLAAAGPVRQATSRDAILALRRE